MEPDFNEDFFNVASVDYNAYKLFSQGEFNISPETSLMYMKIEKARNEYMIKSKDRMEQTRNDFRIFGYSLKSLPVGLNLILTIVVLTVIFSALMLSLKKVMKNEKKAGRKLEKNKKQ